MCCCLLDGNTEEQLRTCFWRLKLEFHLFQQYFTPQPWNKMRVEASWNVMTHAQKPDFVFPWNGRVLLNQRVRQFSWLLAAEFCASAVVMLDTPRSEVVWKGTGYPLHSPSFPLTSPPVRHRMPSHFNWSLKPPSVQIPPIISSTIPFRRCFKSCSAMSDRYRDPLRPTSTNEIYMPSWNPIRIRTLQIIMSVNKENNKNLRHSHF